MAFTDFAKKLLMDTEHFDANNKFVALASGASGSESELSGHGYTRGTWLTSNMTISNSGVVTGAAFTIYQANDGSAVQAVAVALFDSASGGNQLTTWERISSPPAAPVLGQNVNITPTLTP